jgi:thiamine biosynthesis protein ThiS
MQELKITVNGKTLSFEAPLNGAKLIDALSVPRSAVVVELNGKITPTGDFLASELHEGDVIEIVTVVGGGL